MCFDFFYNFCLKYFSLWEELSEIWPKCILVSVYSTRYSCLVLITREFSRHIFEKYSNIFHENPFKYHISWKFVQTSYFMKIRSNITFRENPFRYHISWKSVQISYFMKIRSNIFHENPSTYHISWKSVQISYFTKIRSVGAELFSADGRTDRHDEANCRF